MTTLHRLALSALAVAGFAATAPAQFPIPTYAPQPQYRNPFPPAYPTQPVYSPPVVVQAPPVFVQPRVPTYCSLKEFAREFRPCPGHHHVIITHPVTRQPVEVCFDLPNCRLRDVDVDRRSVEFDYGRESVEIVFNRDGTVCVHDGHGH